MSERNLKRTLLVDTPQEQKEARSKLYYAAADLQDAQAEAIYLRQQLAELDAKGEEADRGREQIFTAGKLR